MRCRRSSKENARPFGTTISPSSTKRVALSEATAAISSGKYRVRDWPDFDCRSTLPPSRKTRQRKPSHLGSYCQFLPSGISSTDKASIGGNGRGSASVIASPTQNGRLWAGRLQNFCAPSHRAADPLVQLLLRRGTNLTRCDLAVLEQHQRRDRHNAVLGGCIRVLVDVELDDLDLVAELTSDLFKRRRDHAAGTTPFRPKVYDHWLGRLQNIRFKTSVRHFADRHDRYLLCWAERIAPLELRGLETMNAVRHRQGALAAT